MLWEWANAYAMSGGVIPNDLPLLIRSTRELDNPEVKGLDEYALYFDAAVHEMRIKDEVPGALGILSSTGRNRWWRRTGSASARSGLSVMFP